MDLRAARSHGPRLSPAVRVHSFTNKRFTVNFRVPIDRLRRIVPDAIQLDEIKDTGFGVLSMCASTLVSWFGWVPFPPVRNNDMLCRISGKVRKGDKVYRAYYTLRSDSSSRFLGFFRKRFSHFRKEVSPFVRVDDGRCVMSSNAKRMIHSVVENWMPLMSSVNKEKPDTTIFSGIEDAKQFVFDLDGSCGYDYGRDMLSFQKIDYPSWDMYFCHEFTYHFPLIDYLCDRFDLRAELDCALFMRNTKQTWGTSWLYRN